MTNTLQTMMYKIFTFTLALTFLSSSTGAQGIDFFHGPWKEALDKAKAEDKLLFVDAYAKWCGPCKAMAKNVFTQQKVGDYFNANFINLKLDMEETDGVTFGHKYEVSAYPTLFFIDGEGKVVKKVVGGQQPDGLISAGADAMKKNDKSGKYAEKYEAGDRSYDLMLSYIKALNAAGKPSLKISNDYLNSNPSITESQKMAFIMEAAVDADSRLFDQVIANKDKMANLVGKEEFEKKCEAACQNSVNKAIEFEMESLLTETIEKAKKTFPDRAEIFSLKSSMMFYKAFKSEQNYSSAYRNLARKSGKDAETLKFIVQDIYHNFKGNVKMVTDATEYAGKLFDIKGDMESMNIYISLLVHNKEIDKALKVVTEARTRAEKKGDTLSEYDGMIQYLNSKKA